MKTLTTSLILSVMFLSAGAFAGASSKAPAPAVAEAAEPTNITVIEKNQAWPLPGRISVEPCSASRCIDV